MNRQADSTIKGFLYQFNKTVKEILELNRDEEIVVEGIIEDIDVLPCNGGTTKKAVQCKYHESTESFTLSLIYKPILQMLEAYAKGVSAERLVIYIHVQNPTQNSISLTIQQLLEVLATTNGELVKIITRIAGPIDLDDFLARLKVEFGPSLSTIEDEVKELLAACFDKGTDVDGISYPNAINIISKLSSEKDSVKRKISKKSLIDAINTTKEVIFTKWIIFTNSRQKALAATRRALGHSLSLNSTKRYIYLCENLIKNFDKGVVAFITSYVDKYHCKATHTSPPLFIINGDRSYISQIVSRLYARGILANDGVLGEQVHISRLLRTPLMQQKRLPQDAEFRIRICDADIFPEVLRQSRPDHLYVVSTSIPTEWDHRDACHHQMAVDDFEDLEYVFSLRGAINV